MCSTTLEALTLHSVGVKSERMENGGEGIGRGKCDFPLFDWSEKGEEIK